LEPGMTRKRSGREAHLEADRNQGAGLRRAAMALLLVFCLLSVFGVNDGLLKTCGLTPLPSQNAEYLEESFEQSLRLFAVLSVVKVTLAVVEGSELGVGFGLEVGDLVQSVYDHVDIAWKAVLVAGVLLQCLRFLLETATYLDQWVMAAAFAIACLFLLTTATHKPKSWLRNVSGDATLVLTVACVVLYLVLPLSVAGARALSQRITAPSLQQAEQGVTSFSKALTDLESNSVGSLTKKIEELKKLLTEKAKSMMVFLFTIIAVYLFDCIIFPLVLFFLLYRGTNMLTRYLFHLKGIYRGTT